MVSAENRLVFRYVLVSVLTVLIAGLFLSHRCLVVPAVPACRQPRSLSNLPAQPLHQGAIEICSILHVHEQADVLAGPDVHPIIFGQGDLELAVNRRIAG